MERPPAASPDTELGRLIDAAVAGHALGLLWSARALADQLQAGAAAPTDPRE